jgi:hypothetical protein
MEQWVRVQNERDRLVLAWLRSQVGDAAIISASTQCATFGGKPYLSAICRLLRLTPPRFARSAAGNADISERCLADIYRILHTPRAGSASGSASMRNR